MNGMESTKTILERITIDGLREALEELAHLRSFRDGLQESGTALYLENQELRRLLKLALRLLKESDEEGKGLSAYDWAQLFREWLAPAESLTARPMRTVAGIMRTPTEIRAAIFEVRKRIVMAEAYAQVDPSDVGWQNALDALRAQLLTLHWLLLEGPAELQLRDLQQGGKDA